MACFINLDNRRENLIVQKVDLPIRVIDLKGIFVSDKEGASRKKRINR